MHVGGKGPVKKDLPQEMAFLGIGGGELPVTRSSFEPKIVSFLGLETFGTPRDLQDISATMHQLCNEVECIGSGCLRGTGVGKISDQDHLLPEAPHVQEADTWASQM